MSLDPTDPANRLTHRPKSRIGSFAHSKYWVRYNRLQPIEAGYITPLYDLRDIAFRYGLSDNGARYFRKYILPEPFDIVRRRSVQAHHWSRFTLMVLDVVLGDLEARGYLQFLKTFEDHIALVHKGVAFLQKHYEDRARYQVLDLTDRHGVQWLE